MKKTVLLIMSLVIMLTFSGCSDQGKKEREKLSVVTTIFPLYDWAREIIGDSSDVELTLLMNKGTDLHNYQPTTDDIIRISESDLFIYVGGESDEWITDILKTAVNRDMRQLNLMNEMKDFLKTEEHVEGMQDDEHSDDEEYDEHIWLSLNNARQACMLILEQLKAIDPANSALYKENYENYISGITTLDDEYRNVINSSTNKTLLFADRFPFRYLVSDYGIQYYAAFSGCSAETEASFETIRFLAEKTDELGLKYIMVLENNNEKIAQAIINSTVSRNQSIEHLDSLQSTTLNDRVTYLEVMKRNLEVLRKVLN